MTLPPVTVVHSLAEARRATAAAREGGRAITLLSAPGAAVFAGCLWWREMIAIVRAEYPDVEMIDVLDCGDDIAQAWAAVRIGLRHLVLVSRVVDYDGLPPPGRHPRPCAGDDDGELHNQRHKALVPLAPEIDALRALALARGVTLLSARRELG